MNGPFQIAQVILEFGHQFGIHEMTNIFLLVQHLGPSINRDQLKLIGDSQETVLHNCIYNTVCSTVFNDFNIHEFSLTESSILYNKNNNVAAAISLQFTVCTQQTPMNFNSVYKF